MKTEKKCAACNQVKPVSDFCRDKTKDSRLSIGYRCYCRKCDADIRKTRKQIMRESKFKAIHNGLSAIVKKVYEAVPIKDHWDKHKIILEIHRLYPSMRDQNAILGCLDTLVRSGLVQEIEPGTFRREHVETNASARAAAAKKPETEGKMSTTDKKDEAALSPIEKITRLQQMAEKIMNDVKALFDAIETVAIEVELQFSERDAESQKLKQLQTLLKGLV